MDNLWVFEYETLMAMRTDARFVAAGEHNHPEVRLIAAHMANQIQAELNSRDNALRIAQENAS